MPGVSRNLQKASVTGGMDGEWEGPLIPNVKYKVSGGAGGREGVSPSNQCEK